MVLSKIINAPDVYYFNDPHVIYTDWLLDHKKVEQLKQYRIVVADFSSEHYGQDTLYLLYDQLESSGLNFLLLVHDVCDHLARPKMLFYPHWYYWCLDNLIDTADQIDRQYLLSCLNGNPRPHRIYNYLQLIKKSYYNHSYITAHSAENLSRGDDVLLDDDMLIEWSNIEHSLSDRDSTLFYGVAKRLDHPAYKDSYIHLVTETTVAPKIFITEKTWKPIAAGQLFLIHGPQHSIKYLRDQGVDVFDDYIDHKYYDSEPDWKVRADRIYQLIESLVTQDLHQYYTQTQDRRQLNKENFFKGKFDPGYLDQIIKCINTQN